MNQLFLFRKEMTPIRKLLLLHLAAGGKLIEQTATGNPLSFTTNLAKPLKSLLLNMPPVQSGTGDPSPTNVRPISGVSAVNVWQTGKNLLNPNLFVNKKVINEDGTISDNTTSKYTELIAVKNVAYTFSGVNGDQYSKTTRIHTYDENRNWIRQIAYQSRSSGASWEITFTPQTSDIYIRISTATELTSGQLELGSTATAYSPYTGQTYPVTFPALGKNLLDPATLEQGGIAENGTEAANNARVRTGYIPVEEGKTYSVSATDLTAFMHIYDANKTGIGLNLGGVNKTMPEGAAFVRCFFRNASNTGLLPSEVTEAMFAEGSTAQTYEPYTNTVYGGSLDVTTGVLTATCYGKVYNGSQSEEWAVTGSGNFACKQDNCKKDERNIIPLCDKFTMEQTYASAYPIRPVDSKDYASDVTEWKTWLASNPIQVVYELAEPVTYQLTPQQITALIGDNTIWSDTNGSNTAVYYKKG